MARLIERTVTIAEGDTESTQAQMGGSALYRILLPATFAGTVIGFKEDWLGAGELPLRNGDGAVSLVVAAGSVRQVPPAEFLALRGVRVVAGTEQTEDVEIVLVGIEVAA